MLDTRACPSCRSPMEAQRLSGLHGQALELDICWPCQGLWFDRHENLKLSPESVVELFRLLHEHRDAQRQPLATTLACLRCAQPLDQGFDVVRSGRYITYRCAGRHGRFSTFSSFMIEKGFVRQMTRPEIEDLARRVASIHCTSCGAPVDIRQDAACPYCKAAFSLIDPQAVARALEGYAQAGARLRAAAAGSAVSTPMDLGDALVALERERSQAERRRRQNVFTRAAESPPALVSTGDLLAVGVALVWEMLND